ncbi:MAG: endonuclease/exonuclease/phosphatase family protein [Planctomycetes bacterium]|nr:endonuclease/exonuclease/phosphatase family protein [Planctomycetota bacterium]
MIRFAAAVIVLATLFPRPVSAEDLDITVVTFNVCVGIDPTPGRRWSQRRPLVVRILSEARPDIVGLQEDFFFQASEIGEALPGYERVGRGAFTEHLGEFNSILYRKDLFRRIDWGVFWLSETPEKEASFAWGHPYPRTVVWCVLSVVDGARKGTRLRVYNTHFPHRGDEPRRRSGETLAARIAADRAADALPAIAMGDLNAGVESPAYQALVGDGKPLLDAFNLAADKANDHGTYHGYKGSPLWSRIDHILVTPGVRVERTRIVEDHEGDIYPSDHYPVLARLAIGE